MVVSFSIGQNIYGVQLLHRKELISWKSIVQLIFGITLTIVQNTTGFTVFFITIARRPLKTFFIRCFKKIFFSKKPSFTLT